MEDPDQGDDGTLSRSVRDVSKAVRAFRKAIEPNSVLNKRIQEQVQPVLQAMQRVQSCMDGFHELTLRMQPASFALQRIEERYRPHMLAIAEGMRRFEEFNRDLVERHKNEALALSPFFNEIALPDLYEVFRDRQKPVLENYREFFADRHHVELLLESWAEDEFYVDRIPILRDALEAHLEGRHTLSIPAFLAQIEGILCHIFDVRDHARVKGKLKQVKFRADDEDRPFASAAFVSRIITEQVFHSSSREKREDQYPSRHQVLHGLDPFYYKDPNASLRCILLLDLLRSEKFLALNGKKRPDQG